ncbi:MAG: hypothetical protein VST69_08650, partial [Nitrospirota bacterium]|nr:hypothetical protein [Nitrospirota bacterium]
MNAFVFANTQNPKQQINGMNASFLPLAGRPLLIYVLMALDRVTQIDKVIVIGATKEIMRAIESVIFEIPFQKRIVVAEEKEYFLESVSFAETESRKKGGVPDGLNMISEPALFLPGNIPFLTTAEVSRFILACDMTEADCYLSIIPGKPTSFFKAEQTQTDIADGEKQGLSLGRLLLAKCDAIGDSDAIKQIEQHYKNRKTDQIFRSLQLETLLKKIKVSPTTKSSATKSLMIKTSPSEIEKQVSTHLKTRFKLTQ